MNNKKIYAYYKLTDLDILDSIEWARENFDRYNGEVSYMWNQHVLDEFARLNKEKRKAKKECFPFIGT